MQKFINSEHIPYSLKWKRERQYGRAITYAVQLMIKTLLFNRLYRSCTFQKIKITALDGQRN
jgi:hypothetical protein